MEPRRSNKTARWTSRSLEQWKPIDGEGTSKKFKEGVEQLFELITNTIDSTFPMKPLAQMVLLDLVAEFKILFHELFVMEVNLFYEDTLNKVEDSVLGAGHQAPPHCVQGHAWGAKFCYGGGGARNGSTPDQRILPLRGA
jgi:hypothetical protein